MACHALDKLNLLQQVRSHILLTSYHYLDLEKQFFEMSLANDAK